MLLEIRPLSFIQAVRELHFVCPENGFRWAVGSLTPLASLRGMANMQESILSFRSGVREGVVHTRSVCSMTSVLSVLSVKVGSWTSPEHLLMRIP